MNFTYADLINIINNVKNEYEKMHNNSTAFFKNPSEKKDLELFDEFKNHFSEVLNLITVSATETPIILEQDEAYLFLRLYAFYKACLENFRFNSWVETLGKALYKLSETPYHRVPYKNHPIFQTGYVRKCEREEKKLIKDYEDKIVENFKDIVPVLTYEILSNQKSLCCLVNIKFEFKEASPCTIL